MKQVTSTDLGAMANAICGGKPSAKRRYEIAKALKEEMSEDERRQLWVSTLIADINARLA